jgi:hypothetical protein
VGGEWFGLIERYWTHGIDADLVCFVAVEMRMYLAGGTQAVLVSVVERGYYLKG